MVCPTRQATRKATSMFRADARVARRFAPLIPLVFLAVSTASFAKNAVEIDYVHYRPVFYETEKVIEPVDEQPNVGGLVLVYLRNTSEETVHTRLWSLNGKGGNGRPVPPGGCDAVVSFFQINGVQFVANDLAPEMAPNCRRPAGMIIMAVSEQKMADPDFVRQA